MKFWPIEYDRVEICETEPLWKQILWVSIYEWDSRPYGMTIRIFGFDFHFYLGRWE